MEKQLIETKYLKTINWQDDLIVDFASGPYYALDGNKGYYSTHYLSFKYNSSIVSSGGTYALVFDKHGTKGIILKNGEFLREINRSYQHSHFFEYPAVFFEYKDRTYLAHCPFYHYRLDFEDAETGKIITNSQSRNPIESLKLDELKSLEYYHSRLEVSSDNKYLLSKGFFWHPTEAVILFDIENCINDPIELDNFTIRPKVSHQISSATFLNDSKILIGSIQGEAPYHENNFHNFPPQHIGIWDIKTGNVSSPIPLKNRIGNLYAIDENFAWDIYEYPKIINIYTGEIVDSDKSIYSGKQICAVYESSPTEPMITYSRKNKKLAVLCNDQLIILSK